MEVINKVKVYDTENIVTRTGIKYIGDFTIKQEIIGYQNRTILVFTDSEGNEIDYNKSKKWVTKLRERIFSKEELKFIAKKYSIALELDNRLAKVRLSATNRSVHLLYGFYSEIVWIEENQKEYLMIIFRRWQHEYQPRGIGEDVRGEDVTYIHGIWEAPLLTDEIIEKIKQNAR